MVREIFIQIKFHSQYLRHHVCLHRGRKKRNASGAHDVSSGSKAPLWPPALHFRPSPGNGHRQGRSPCQVGLALSLTAENGTSVMLVLSQYKCIGCSPGKTPRHSNDGNWFRHRDALSLERIIWDHRLQLIKHKCKRLSFYY